MLAGGVLEQASVAEYLNGMSTSGKFGKKEARFRAALSDSVNGNGTHLNVDDVEDGAYHLLVVQLPCRCFFSAAFCDIP